MKKPKVVVEEKKVVKSIHVIPSVWAELRLRAVKEETNVSAIVEALIRGYLKEKGKK